MNGYGGLILRINLTTRKVSKSSTPEELARDYIGGRGFGAYFLYREVPQGADPLGPDNKLILSSGPLSGLMIPGAGKCDIACKSPLTGGYASASVGGLLAAEIKYAGYDSIILEGASDKPVYIVIDDERVEIRDASVLWGKGSITVEKELKDELGDEFQMACIGPAAEKGVRYAHINHDFGRQAGRGGVGTVMGLKKVKAMAIRGTKSIPVANMGAYRKAGMALYKACKDSDGLKPWQSYGTTMVVSWSNEIGALPTRNFSAGSFDQAKSLFGPIIRDQIVINDKSCFGCPSPCGKYSRMGRYGTRVEGPEYETIGMVGSNLGISDAEDVAQINYLCDEWGIDTISAGGAIAWAMECYEKGILTLADTDGLELKFGNVPAVLAMIERIGKREGLGALLGEGTKRAAQKIGKGSEKFAIQVKGMEQSAYATHNATGMLLSYMTADVGAHHNRAWAITYDLEVGREAITADKVARVIWLQHVRPAFDMMGACRLQWVELSIDLELYPPALEAITGIKRSWKDLELASERVWNLTRMYWLREQPGFGREWDMPAPRFYTDAPQSGATAGQITKLEDMNRMLDMYYVQRGWSSAGLPKPETLQRLGLSEM